METTVLQNLDINAIPLADTQEHIDKVNAKLKADLETYATRPFLHKQERNDLGEYFSTWGINYIIALFNFDRDGNYLPDLYQAPKEVQRMIYPIDDLMNFERQGTLVIDREQYSPELRNLSFFIYMVDADMYDEYKQAQHFNGPTAPTFMFNQHANDGVRIFRDYFALARHLRKQRLVTYCLGPRTTFYLRYFIHQIHVHTVDNDYAYGRKEDGKRVRTIIESIKRHLAFNTATKKEYKVDFKDDPVATFRMLKSAYKVLNLPEAKEFKCTTDIVRYQKQNLAGTVYHMKHNKVSKYEQVGIHDYYNMILYDNYMIFFIWDTRRIKKIVDVNNNTDNVDPNDFIPVKFDARTDLVCEADIDTDIREICEQLHTILPIQMRDKAVVYDF
jgi:hypothetical protein